MHYPTYYMNYTTPACINETNFSLHRGQIWDIQPSNNIPPPSESRASSDRYLSSIAPRVIKVMAAAAALIDVIFKTIY